MNQTKAFISIAVIYIITELLYYLIKTTEFESIVVKTDLMVTLIILNIVANVIVILKVKDYYS